MDPVARIWLAQNLGNLNYGTYDVDGSCTYNGNVTGIQRQSGQEPTAIVIDQSLSCWFCAAQLNNKLWYGTYSQSTGMPTIGGSIATGITEEGGSHGLVIDTDLRLWWIGNDSGTRIAYGTYNTGGIPTAMGTQTGLATLSNHLTIDQAHRRIWVSNQPYVYAYDASGVLSQTTTPYTDVFRGAVDYDRSIMVATNPGKSAYVLYGLAPDGGLSVMDSLATADNPTSFAVDPALGLALCNNGHMLSYCA